MLTLLYIHCKRMSRVLRQIFKKIFYGDLFRPAAIFFCAPAAALTPSRTVCASSFPDRCLCPPRVLSRRFVLEPRPSRLLPCTFSPFLFPLSPFAGRSCANVPFPRAERLPLSLAMHAHDPHAFFLSHALFYIVACAYALCIFLLLRAHTPRTLIFCCQTSCRR